MTTFLLIVAVVWALFERDRYRFEKKRAEEYGKMIDRLAEVRDVHRDIDERLMEVDL